MLQWAEAWLARNKPGRAFVGLTHRLDRPVGGVMALAKTSKAASRLSQQFRERTTTKNYLALVSGCLSDDGGRLEQNLVREGDFTRPAKAEEKGTRAVLDWRPRRQNGEFALLEITLLTGFKHQIRAQLSLLGCPVVGDRRYGSTLVGPEGASPAIGLWAEALSIEHPTRKEKMTFECRPPAGWPWNMFNE